MGRPLKNMAFFSSDPYTGSLLRFALDVRLERMRVMFTSDPFEIKRWLDREDIYVCLLDTSKPVPPPVMALSMEMRDPRVPFVAYGGKSGPQVVDHFVSDGWGSMFELIETLKLAASRKRGPKPHKRLDVPAAA